MRKSILIILIGLLLAALSFCMTPHSAQAALNFRGTRRYYPTQPRPARVAPPIQEKTITTASIADFAHAYELKTTLEGAIYKTALPKFVYEGLVVSQRRDLAVFNADGLIVPFTLREAVPTSSVSVRTSEYRLPFYELPTEAQTVSTVGHLDVYVKTDASGHVVSVKSDGKSGSEKRDRSYILDLSSIMGNKKTNDGEIVRRELRLRLPDVKLSVKLSVLESANLRDWKTILTDIPLLQLKNEKTRLTSDNIELPRTPNRYVLLQIRGIDQSFELNGVDYYVTVQERSSSIREENTEIGGTIVYDDNRNVNVEYDAFGAFPISKLNFVLQEPGFYKVAYFSRQDLDSKWQARGEMELTMILSQNGSVISNAPTSINEREDRFWRISFEGAFHGAPPIMKIIWRPSDVFFLAQGKSPYVLAFGSNEEGLSLQNGAFLKGGYAIEAELGAAVIIPSIPDIKPAPVISKETPEWQRYMVWGLLALCGLLLSGIAWKLLKS